MPQSLIGTDYVKHFDVSTALCTMADGILSSDKVSGEFNRYLYSIPNGKQVLLGHYFIAPLSPGDTAYITQSVFVSREDGVQRREPATWEALRDFVAQAWVIGTDRYPGVKLWLASKAHNLRRAAETVYVFLRK